ncbi:MAG: ABC transporter ATP-binding protein [Candidatus Eisenbacteria bacterium]|nr:ABC transporter ATP-binding protein [Candidatus Eisenbacteria bacterium]
MSHGPLVVPDEDVLQKGLDAALFRRLLVYLRPYRGRTALAVLLLILLSALALVGPWITKIAIDRAIVAENIALQERARTLARMGVLFLIVLVLEFTIRYVQVYITQVVGQRVMVDLRMEIFSHLQKMPLSYFQKNPTGRLITRVTSDVDVLNELFTSGVVQIFGDVFLLAGIVAAMLVLNAPLALTVFSVAPLLFAASFLFRKKVRRAFRDVRARVARVNAWLQECLVGMRVIQLFNAEERTFRVFDERNAELRDSHVRTVLYHSIFFPVVEVIGALAVALLVWRGGGAVLSGALTFGVLAAFLQYTGQFFRPIRDLSEKYNILQSAMASSERIFLLLDTPPAIAAPEAPARPGPLEEAIRFENVSFAYRPGEPVLREVSLTVRKGERVALVGATGSGKSTLVSLLERFWDPEDGRITLDGVDLRDMDPRDLRRRIGTVLQDVTLFSGTVEGNIRLGDESIPPDRITEATRIANADRFIERLPEGYDHALRERGSGLSAGERQLLAFSRALAVDPEIFVLDEATANIDSETEALIQEALERILRGRTALIIAHRLSTIRRVDRIVVLHHGRVREEGTHEELIRNGGIYKKLHDLEYRGPAPETG